MRLANRESSDIVEASAARGYRTTRMLRMTRWMQKPSPRRCGCIPIFAAGCVRRCVEPANSCPCSSVRRTRRSSEIEPCNLDRVEHRSGHWHYFRLRPGQTETQPIMFALGSTKAQAYGDEHGDEPRVTCRFLHESTPMRGLPLTLSVRQTGQCPKMAWLARNHLLIRRSLRGFERV